MKSKILALFVGVFFIMPFPLPHSASANNMYSPHFGIHVDDPSLITDMGGVDNFVNACVDKGYTAIIFNAIPWEYYFYSPTLSALGWEYGGDMLKELSEKCKSRGIKLIVDIQSLAQKVREEHPDWPGIVPTEKQLEEIFDELLSYGIDGISEEMFPASWFRIASEKMHETGAIYIHKFIPYDVAWLCMDNSSIFDSFPYADVIMTEDYYLDSDFLRAQMAAGLARQLWIKSSTADWALGMDYIKNVLAMRLAQYHPEYVFLMIYDKSNFLNFSPDDISYYGNYNVKGNRTMNVVAYLTDEPGNDENMKDFDPWQLFDVSYAAIAGGATAAGYEIEITRYPLKNADAYYVYTRGGWWGENVLDLPENITSLLYSDKPVFIEVAGTLPQHGNWEKIRAIFGISSREFDIIFKEGNAVYGSIDGIDYGHLSDDWFYVNNIRPDDVNGNIISEGIIDGREYVLIISSGSKYFINGAGLHMEAGFAISKLLNGAMQKPCDASINSGKDMGVLAFSNTQISLKLPEGEYIYEAISPYGDIRSGSAEGMFNYSCMKGEAIFIMKNENNVSVHITRPENGVYVNDRKIFSSSTPIIIGRITIEAECSENVKNVSFYVDSILKYVDDSAPYSWTWDEFAVGKHVIKVIARASFNSSMDENMVLIINLK